MKTKLYNCPYEYLSTASTARLQLNARWAN